MQPRSILPDLWTVFQVTKRGCSWLEGVGRWAGDDEMDVVDEEATVEMGVEEEAVDKDGVDDELDDDPDAGLATVRRS